MAVMRAAAAAALWEDRIPLYQFSLQFTPVPAYPSPQRSKLYQVRPVRRQVKSRPIIIYRWCGMVWYSYNRYGVVRYGTVIIGMGMVQL